MDIVTSKNGKRALGVFFGLLVVFLYAPLVTLLVFSFNDNNLPVFPLRGFTTRAYEQFASNPDLKASLVTSAEVAAMSSAVAVALGMVAAIALVRRRFVAKAAASALLLSPLVVPYIALAIGLLIFFNEVGMPLSIMTIVMGHVVLSVPYTILVLAPRLERIDVRLEEAARDLGAGALRTFRSITLPLVAPAIVSAFLIAFTLSFDEFAIASFLTTRSLTWPVYLFAQLRFPVLLPQLIAVSVIVMALSIAVVVAAEVFRRQAERHLDFAPPA